MEEIEYMDLRENGNTPNHGGVYKQDIEEKTQQFRYKTSMHLETLIFIFAILCFLLSHLITRRMSQKQFDLFLTFFLN